MFQDRFICLSSLVKFDSGSRRVVVSNYNISLSRRSTLGQVTLLPGDESPGVLVHEGLHVAEMVQVPRLGSLQSYFEGSVH